MHQMAIMESVCVCVGIYACVHILILCVREFLFPFRMCMHACIPTCMRTYVCMGACVYLD